MEQIPYLNKYFSGDDLMCLTNIIRLLQADPQEKLAWQLLKNDNLLNKLSEMLMEIYDIPKTPITNTYTYRKLIIYHSVRTKLCIELSEYIGLLRMEANVLKLPIYPLSFTISTMYVPKLICLDEVQYPITLGCTSFYDEFKKSQLGNNLKTLYVEITSSNMLDNVPSSVTEMVIDVVVTVSIDLTRFDKLKTLNIVDYSLSGNLQSFCALPKQLQNLTIRNFKDDCIVINKLWEYLPNLQVLSIYTKQMPIWHEQIINCGFSLTKHTQKLIVYEKNH